MRSLSLFIALLVSGSGSALAEWESTILPQSFRYESSFAAASARASEENKTLIVYYTRTRCPPCDWLRAMLKKESVGAPFRDNYVFTVVWGSSMGYKEREQYRSQFGVQGAPTWIVYNPKGQYLCTARGGFDSDEGGAKLHAAVQALRATEGGSGFAVRDCVLRG